MAEPQNIPGVTGPALDPAHDGQPFEVVMKFIMDKPLHAITPDEMAFLEARESYMTEEQRKIFLKEKPKAKAKADPADEKKDAIDETK